MPIYDKNGMVIAKSVFKALAKPDIVEIKNRTLDGLYHIQTIGTGGTSVDVTAYIEPQEKILLDTIKRRSAPIMVVFCDESYVGVIDGGLSYDRLSASNALMFAVTFTLLTSQEFAGKPLETNGPGKVLEDTYNTFTSISGN